MSGIAALLQQAGELRLFRSLDIQFARMIASEDHPALMLAAACVSAEAGEGHVCLPLAQFTEQALFDGRQPELARQLWRAAGEPAWLDLLQNAEAVGDGSIGHTAGSASAASLPAPHVAV